MERTFDDLRRSPELKQVGCVIVAILTHGKCDSNGEVIFGVDGMMFFKFDGILSRGKVVVYFNVSTHTSSEQRYYMYNSLKERCHVLSGSVQLPERLKL